MHSVCDAVERRTGGPRTWIPRLRRGMLGLAGRSPDQTSDEVAFCDAYEETLNDETMVVTHLLVLVLTLPITALFYYYMETSPFRLPMLLLHGLIWTMNIAVIPFRNQRKVIRSVIWTSFLALMLFYAWAGRETLADTTDYVVVGKVTAAVLTTGIFALLVVGNKMHLKLLYGGLAMAGCAYAFASVHFVLTLASAVVIILIGIVLFLLHHYQYRMARREYVTRTHLAPAHIIRNAGIDLQGFEATMAPRLKRCVCICTDWRGYQALSENLLATELADMLGAYYERCEEVLRSVFTDGNYYSDWIADELFIVAYEIPGTAPGALVDQALRASMELIAAKDEFCASRGVPLAIDLGLSYGDAVVGMMGPRGFRKATALGVTPGRARRFQSAGKALREDIGDRDRIVFGRDLLMQIRLPLEIGQWTLPTGQMLRNIDDRDVFYIQSPAAQTDQTFVAGPGRTIRSSLRSAS